VLGIDVSGVHGDAMVHFEYLLGTARFCDCLRRTGARRNGFVANLCVTKISNASSMDIAVELLNE
jgi:hypothetical protein